MSYEERKPKPGLPTAVLTIRGSEFRIPHTCLSKTLDCEKLNQFLTQNNESSQEIKYDLNRPIGPFQAILEYCHNGKLHLPPSVCPGVFRDELAFWALSPNLLQNCCFYRYQNFLGEERNLSGFEDMCRNDKKEAYTFISNNSKARSKIWNILNSVDNSAGSKIYHFISTIMIVLAILNIVLITFLPVQHTTSVNGSESVNVSENMTQMDSNLPPIVTELPPRIQDFSVDVQCSDCKNIANAKSFFPFIKSRDIIIGSTKGTIKIALLDCCQIKYNGTRVLPISLGKAYMENEVTELPPTQQPTPVKIEQFLMKISCGSCSQLLWPHIQEYDVIGSDNPITISIHIKSLDCCSLKANWKPIPRHQDTADNSTLSTILLPNTSVITGDNRSALIVEKTSKTLNTLFEAVDSIRDSMQKRISSISELASNEIRLTTFVEYITTLFFFIEFVSRILSCPDKRLYFRGYLNCIDLILLTANLCRISFTNWIQLGNNMILEISLYISMFRVLRLFRIVEHLTAFKVLRYSFRRGKGDLCVLIMYMLVAMFIFSNFIYMVENEADFPSIPDAWWWSIVTMTTVGYGDMYPKTLPGKVIGCFCAIFGIVMLSLVIPVFANSFLTIYEYADYYKTTNDKEMSTGKCDCKSDREQESVAMDTHVSTVK